MQQTGQDAEPQFSQPVRQILTMLIIIGLAGFGGYVAYPSLGPVFLSSIYLNGFIGFVFVVGVAACFWQVFALISSVSWIEGFAIGRPGHERMEAPRLLSSLATLLGSRSSRMQISALSSRSILDSMATRLDEGREITRYIINLLIFLGLLGTFFGLATTVPAVVETIRSLAPTDGESGADVFGRLMTGLEKQMGGMGTAFGSSLLGLAGSLVVGLLDLFAGHGQNRFYRELEEWLSSITRLGFSQGEGEGGVQADAGYGDAIFAQMADSMDSLQNLFVQSDVARTLTDEKLGKLADAVMALTKKIEAQKPAQVQAAAPSGRDERVMKEQLQALRAISSGQEKIAGGQDNIAKLLGSQIEEQIDPESRMRLRSIDVQLLRILEEMSAGRQDTVSELRSDIAGLTKEISKSNRKPPVQPQAPQRRGKA